MDITVNIDGSSVRPAGSGYAVETDGRIVAVQDAGDKLACSNPQCLGNCAHVRMVKQARPHLSQLASDVPVEFTLTPQEQQIVQVIGFAGLAKSVDPRGGIQGRVVTTLGEATQLRDALAASDPDRDARSIMGRLDVLIASTSRDVPLAKGIPAPHPWEGRYFAANAGAMHTGHANPAEAYNSATPEQQHALLGRLHQRMAEGGVERPVEPDAAGPQEEYAKLTHRVQHAKAMLAYHPKKGTPAHQLKWDGLHRNAFSHAHDFARANPGASDV